MKIYLYDKERRLFAEDVAERDPVNPERWLIPADATTVVPPAELAGYRRVFDAVLNAWNQELIPVTAADAPAAEKTPAQKRKEEIILQMDVLDKSSIRAMRAILAAQNTLGAVVDPADVQRVKDVDANVKLLRDELKALVV
jgi:hypothetical protein